MIWHCLDQNNVINDDSQIKTSMYTHSKISLTNPAITYIRAP